MASAQPHSEFDEEAKADSRNLKGSAMTDHDNFSDADEHMPDQESKQDRRLQRALMRNGDKRSARDLAVILDALNSMRDEFIKDLTDEVKEALCSRLTLEEFEKGDKVFEYGEFGDKLYLIWSGRVSIEIPRSHEAARRNKMAPEHVELIPLTRLDPGRAFGELALISENKTRSARVTAVKRTLLMVLQEADYIWGVGMGQGSFVKERVQFLRAADRSVLEDISEVDLRAMAGHLRLESHIGDHTILKQGSEVDRVIFVKSGFCKVIRQLHPRFKKQFDDYAERGSPPPNPFADDEEEPSSPLLPKCGGAEPPESVEEALALHLGLGSRQALHKLMSKYHEDDTKSRAKSTASTSSALTARVRTDTITSSASSGGAAAAVASGGSPSDNTVVLGILHAGMSFGVMEMMEGFAYQSSVVANPWAEVYVMTKYDLIRNTSKTILHKLFNDYKARLSDERLVQRLKQRRRWNNYKRDLWDQIRERKTSNQIQYGIDRRTVNRRAGTGDLSVEDYERVGAGEILWDGRAQTPPKPTYSHKHGKEYVFHVHCYRNQGTNSPNVVVEHDARDASLSALEEKILMTIATARYRAQLRRNNAEEEGEQSEQPCKEQDEEQTQQEDSQEASPAVGQAPGSGKHARLAVSEKKGTLPSLTQPNKTKSAHELDELAQSAAADYLDKRKSHIKDLQKAGKDRATAAEKQSRPGYSRKSTMHRSFSRKSTFVRKSTFG